MKLRFLLTLAGLLVASPAVASDYVFRARPLAIEVPAPALPPLPDGAIRSGPDVLQPLRVVDGWHALPAGTYRTLRPIAEIVADLYARGQPTLRLQFHSRGDRYAVCYVSAAPTQSLLKCSGQVLRAGADARATVTDRDGYLYVVTPTGFSILDRDPEVRASLAALGLHRVPPPEQVSRP